ncbi:hypothetical protein [Spirosoma sordidisoli]|uniref:Uncharacterized protein n=1 Tax=Spirosoma sordidisoli TaxID=2502893 RepID=A0A4Q2UQ63_9BACT|nr:hypothetical protein [Spirosoma sordidisoli]RYC71654.1 hypothetical protein EQG79_05845 [Spirosoma sordidisoli]
MNVQKIPYALLIGVQLGLFIWSSTQKEGILPFLLLVFSLLIGSRLSKNRKTSQEETSCKEALH